MYEKLPRDIAERHVLLLDPMLGCGSSAVKAIEVLWCRGSLEYVCVLRFGYNFHVTVFGCSETRSYSACNCTAAALVVRSA